MSSEIQIPTLSLDFRDFIKSRRTIEELVREFELRLHGHQGMVAHLTGPDPL